MCEDGATRALAKRFPLGKVIILVVALPVLSAVIDIISEMLKEEKVCVKIIILLALAFTAIFPAGQAFAEDEKKDVMNSFRRACATSLKT